MSIYTCTDKRLHEQKADAMLFFLKKGAENDLPRDLLTFVDDNPVITATLKKQKFTGSALSTFVVPVSCGKQVTYLIGVGLGDEDASGKIALETYRRALATAIRQAQKVHATSCALSLPAATLFGTTKEFLAQQTAVTVGLTSYAFDQFITDDARKKTPIKNIIITTDAGSKKRVSAALADGEAIADSVNKARLWIDTPPSDLTPPALATKAAAIAKKHGLELTVFDEKQIIKMGMGGLAGVSRGSALDCRLVVIRYTAKKKNAPTLALVGKGITFDSGGLSLKPAQYMETMKEDMSGAAAVLGAMNAIGYLKPDCNVVGVMPLAENLPGESALKPGDIITFYNGKTAEILNTDAEGRLILADALAYATKEIKPDAMIDLATLTGACQHALGPFFTGLMSQHPALAKQIEQAGDRTGDRVWPLPFNDDYKAAIVSSVADIRNTGKSGYYAGSVTAGFFLQNFVGETPWAHLDIAGTAFNVPDRPYFNNGATGAGVRLLVDLIMQWHA